MFVDNKKEQQLYAELYSKLEISGTQFLGFRDIPNLIKSFVKGKKTLDYGCGAGKSTLLLKSMGLEVNGVDINDTMVEEARTSDPSGDYKTIKTTLPFADNTYDLVFNSWVLVEIPTKTKLLAAVKEMSRVLKSGGVFIAVTTSEKTYNADWLSLSTLFDENKNLKSGNKVKVYFKDIDLSIYDYFWSETDYKEALENANLELIATHTPLGRENEGFNWLTEKTRSPYVIYVVKKP